MILYFNFLPCLLRNKAHIDMELGFNPFLEGLPPLTSQNYLLANNCQKKIDLFFTSSFRNNALFFIFLLAVIFFPCFSQSMHQLSNTIADAFSVGENLVFQMTGVRDGRLSADAGILAGYTSLQDHC